MITMREQLKALYLDYVNNYLTVDKIAEHHLIAPETMLVMISAGWVYHHQDLELLPKKPLKPVKKVNTL